MTNNYISFIFPQDTEVYFEYHEIMYILHLIFFLNFIWGILRKLLTFLYIYIVYQTTIYFGWHGMAVNFYCKRHLFQKNQPFSVRTIHLVMSKQTFSRDSLVLIDSKTIQKVACSSTHLNDLHLYCIYKESNKEIQNRMILMIYLLDKIQRRKDF